MKILAIKWRRLGDTILWTSALQALLEHFPNAQIDLALPAEYDVLFQHDSLFKTRFRLESDWRSQLSLIRLWQKEHYDLALAFHASRRTRILARKSGAKHCIIHHHSRKGLTYGSDSPVVNRGQPMSAIERDLNVPRTLGWQGVAPATRITPDPSWIARVKLPFDRPIVLSPGASRLSKRWPMEHYRALVDRLPAGAPVVVVATSEKDLFSADKRPFGHRAIVRYTPALEEAAGLLAQARCFVGADSGMKHLACALGVPTVTLFGPESVGEWHPYSTDRHTALQRSVGCRSNDTADPKFAWCGVEVCPLASHACLRLISPDDVYQAIERYL